jgi:hypothetical protein
MAKPQPPHTPPQKPQKPQKPQSQAGKKKEANKNPEKKNSILKHAETTHQKTINQPPLAAINTDRNTHRICSFPVGLPYSSLICSKVKRHEVANRRTPLQVDHSNRPWSSSHGRHDDTHKEDALFFLASIEGPPAYGYWMV